MASTPRLRYYAARGPLQRLAATSGVNLALNLLGRDGASLEIATLAATTPLLPTKPAW